MTPELAGQVPPSSLSPEQFDWDHEFVNYFDDNSIVEELSV